MLSSRLRDALTVVAAISGLVAAFFGWRQFQRDYSEPDLKLWLRDLDGVNWASMQCSCSASGCTLPLMLRLSNPSGRHLEDVTIWLRADSESAEIQKPATTDWNTQSDGSLTRWEVTTVPKMSPETGVVMGTLLLRVDSGTGTRDVTLSWRAFANRASPISGSLVVRLLFGSDQDASGCRWGQ